MISRINSYNIYNRKNHINFGVRLANSYEIEKEAHSNKELILDKASEVMFNARDTFNKLIYFAYGSDFSIKPLDPKKYNLTEINPYRYVVETKFDKNCRTIVSYNPQYMRDKINIVEELGFRQDSKNKNIKTYTFQNGTLENYTELKEDKHTNRLEEESYTFLNGELSCYSIRKYNPNCNETSRRSTVFNNNKIIGFGYVVNSGNKIKGK